MTPPPPDLVPVVFLTVKLHTILRYISMRISLHQLYQLDEVDEFDEFNKDFRKNSNGFKLFTIFE